MTSFENPTVAGSLCAIEAASADRPPTRLATRLAFLVAGFGVACWAPLVPFAKARLQVDDGALGLLLLMLGLGSLASMGFTGMLSARFGARPIILAGGFGLAVLLPLLTLAGSPLTLGVSLFAFGAALGALDVAMNIHAVEVERAAGRPLMSGFHALFSVGGFLGASLMTALLWAGLGAATSSALAALLMAAATAAAAPRLLRAVNAEETPLFVMPHSGVLALAALAAIMFLVEGAVLDWSALLVTGRGLVSAAEGGVAFTLFSIAMTAGRLGGDIVVARVGDRAALAGGGLIAMSGFAVALMALVPALALAGFLLIGLGASNIVPVLFRRAGAQRAMPVGLAVAAISTAGYAGLLVGPAAVGFVAKLAGLPIAFAALGVLVAVVVVSARAVTAPAK